MQTRFVLAVMVFCASLPGQITQRVNPDLSVTYFVDAPDAKDVRLADSVFSQHPPGLPLTKGPDGSWSITTPRYQPGTYEYRFVLDGVLSGDAWGSALREPLPRRSFPFEMIDVCGCYPLFHDLQLVPHGAVHIET